MKPVSKVGRGGLLILIILQKRRDLRIIPLLWDLWQVKIDNDQKIL